MTTCERLSDRMATVARGEAEWTAEEARHLAECPDCEAEWRLTTGAQRLLGSLSIDGDAMATRVAGRLAADREPPVVVSLASRRSGIVWALALAAAAVLAVAAPRLGGRHRSEAAGPGPTAGVEQPVLSELDDMSARELERVLDEIDGGAVGADTDRARMGDLTPAELERVLRSWES